MADHEEYKWKNREQETRFFVADEAEEEDVKTTHVEHIWATTYAVAKFCVVPGSYYRERI